MALGRGSRRADGSKSKKKGLALDPVQTQALRAATGVLKFLSVLPTCAFIVSHIGCLPTFVSLLDHQQLSIRRNCHILLGALPCTPGVLQTHPLRIAK